MSNDKMREEFEAWFKANTNNNDGVEFYVGINGKYCFTDIEMVWQSWQASRATLEVELPFEFVNGMMRADKVISAIEASGVGVKP